MKNKKLNYLRIALAAVLLLTGFSIRAQVTVGAEDAPQDFSILEIVSGGTGGFRLPQMTSEQRRALAVSGKTLARGLAIYNTDTDCVEYWNGTAWVNDCGLPSQPDKGSIAFNPVYNTYTTSTDLYNTALAGGLDDEKTRGTDIRYSNVDAGVFRYTGAEGQILPRLTFTHGSGLTVTIPAQTLAGSSGSTAGGQITVNVSGVLSADYAGKAFDIPLTLLGANLTVRVNVGCGAYLDDKMVVDANGMATNWKQFQCYNLGASTNTDPFTPNQNLHGAKYKFGAKNASLTMIQDQDAANDASVANWTYTGPYPYQNDANEWNTANNPCSSGWRVPTRTEWASVVNTSYNTASRTDAGTTWGDSSTNYSSGIYSGNGLFLPAAGTRDAGTGQLLGRGSSGSYWSNGSDGSALYFTGSSANAAASHNRQAGISVRCVAE